ncbi:MAG: hypothetical protein HOW97_22520 [Catenulispora sp.]|nr:hypothetical protein [Catenulispora sp.]
MAKNVHDTADTPEPDRGPSRGDRIIDLVALLSLLGAGTGVYLATGPDVFAAVTGVSAGLFTTWHRRKDSD